MAENSLYSAWTWELALPEPFGTLEKGKKLKRISCLETDCSRHNKRSRGKQARLHPPTLVALLRLLGIKNGESKGACGIQRHKEVNYFLMEYEKPEGTCVIAYNRKNGRFTGQRLNGVQKEWLLCVRKDKSNGEEYLALLAYASLCPGSPLYDEEFAESFSVLEQCCRDGWKETDAFVQAAFRCCDNLYRRMMAPPEEAIPLDLEQLYTDGEMGFLPSFEMAFGVYGPNDQIWGTFEHLAVQKTGGRSVSISEMKERYSGVFYASKESIGRIPSLPETYRVSEDAEEILQRVTETPARMFMLTGSAGAERRRTRRLSRRFWGCPIMCSPAARIRMSCRCLRARCRIWGI